MLNKGNSYNLTVKLTGCGRDEFTCDDGQCIDIIERCDQLVDCRDKSDERNCQLLILDYGYNSEIPPFTTVCNLNTKSSVYETYFYDENKKLVPASVNISTVFKTVIDINEQDHSINLKFLISLEWYEGRADYFNLKENSALNVLSNEEIEQIWIPYIIFEVCEDFNILNLSISNLNTLEY